MYYDTLKLLNLERYKSQIENIDVKGEGFNLSCTVKIKPKFPFCPICGVGEPSKNGLYNHRVTHSVSNCKNIELVICEQKYKCKVCKHVFHDTSSIAEERSKVSNITKLIVLEKLKNPILTYTSIAKEMNLTTTTVINIFDQVKVRRKPLEEIISIDEFYTGKTKYRKFACVIYNFKSKKISDIYSNRRQERMDYELSKISREERLGVKYATIDMYEPYKRLIKIWFKNATIIVDSFHVIKHLTEALDKIRIKISKEYDRGLRMKSNDSFYYFLKRFRFFLTRPFDKLPDKFLIGRYHVEWTKEEILEELLSIDKDLRDAFMLKERYVNFNREAKLDDCDEELDDLIHDFLNSKFEEYVEFGKMLLHWKQEIKNSFIRFNSRRLSNGPIEGINSMIKKTLKNGNGFENFPRFRNRCLYSINSNYTKKQK